MTSTHLHYVKYDGTEHWRIEAELVREDEAGWWLRGQPGAKAERPGLVVVEKVGFLCHVPRDAWWAAYWNFDRENDYELYIDVASPAEWHDGELRLVDLDLDVARDWEGRVHLLDEDEFEDHAVKMHYPDDVRRAARSSADALVEAVTARTPPFDLFDARTSQF
jgi:protein associated with RNAse G/E